MKTITPSLSLTTIIVLAACVALIPAAKANDYAGKPGFTERPVNCTGTWVFSSVDMPRRSRQALDKLGNLPEFLRLTANTLIKVCGNKITFINPQTDQQRSIKASGTANQAAKLTKNTNYRVKAWQETDSIKIETIYNQGSYYRDLESRFFEQLIPIDENAMKYRFIIEKLDSTEEAFWGELLLLKK